MPYISHLCGFINKVAFSSYTGIEIYINTGLLTKGAINPLANPVSVLLDAQGIYIMYVALIAY